MNIVSKVEKFFEHPIEKHIWIFPVFIGAILRFYKLTASSIWHDEGYTMWLIRYNPLEIISRTARDVHPPGYYLLAKPWTMIFGDSVFAVRTLSVFFSVGIIYLTFKIIEKLFGKKEAFWASLFVALSPFMIRFAQEARMYGVVAFFTTLGTYFLVRFIKDKNNKLLIPYFLSMAVAIYTQYYAFFVIISHWLILAIATPGFFTFRWGKSFKEKLRIFSPYWWIANISLLLVYIPWFPVAYKQVTRVSGSYWIKPEWITIKTIPGSIFQFMLYDHVDDIYTNLVGKSVYWIVVILVMGSGLVLFKRKEWRASALCLFIFGYLPMILVFTLSKLRTPVYQDRYFPFSAIAILAIWGITVSMIKNKGLRVFVGTIAILLLLIGNTRMHINTNHQMKLLSETVKKEMKSGDILLSGELYTFLDGTYYLGDKNIRFISEPVDGYGESSLFYDQQGQYVISKDSLASLGSNHRIIVIGKTGDKDYFKGCLLKSREGRELFTENKENGLRAIVYE